MLCVDLFMGPPPPNQGGQVRVVYPVVLGRKDRHSDIAFNSAGTAGERMANRLPEISIQKVQYMSYSSRIPSRSSSPATSHLEATIWR